MKLQFAEKECKVLVACSGGPSSSALLCLMANFCKVDPSQQMRKPRFPSIICVHVDQSILFDNPSLCGYVEKLAQLENVPFHSTKLESIFEGSYSNMFKDQLGKTVVDLKTSGLGNAEILLESLNSVGDNSSKEDLVHIYTMRALRNEARRNGCNVIILGNNSTQISIKVISDTAKGRGIALATTVALEEPREIVIVKPLRDTLAEEIAVFNQYKSIVSYPHPSLTTGMPSNASIERLTANFIMGVQKDFPSTVSTISRTAFKVNSIVPDGNPNCAFCSG